MNKKIINITAFCFLILCQPLFTQTWSSRKRLTWTSDHSVFPAAAVYTGGRIHLVWMENEASGPGVEIYYKRTTDGGSSWLPSKRLTWNSGKSERPAILVDNFGRVFVFWNDETPGNFELYYRKSMDGGVTWLKPRRMTFNSADMDSPASACVDSSNRIHLIYSDRTYGYDQVFYRTSTNGGQDWTSIHRVTYTFDAFQPKIALDSSGIVHLVWMESNKDDEIEIYYKKRLSNGTWTGQRRLTWHLQGSFYPSITIDSADTVHVVWSSLKTGSYEIFYRKSTDKGATWSTANRITWTGGSEWPMISVDSNKDLHLVWMDESLGQYEVYYKKCIFSVGWFGNKRLTWNSGASEFPYIVIDSSDDLHVFWNDNTPGNCEIFYRYYSKKWVYK